MKKRRILKRLGEGYPWFHALDGVMYVAVSLNEKQHATGKKIELNTNDLGAWQKIRLWAEPIPERKSKR